MYSFIFYILLGILHSSWQEGKNIVTLLLLEAASLYRANNWRIAPRSNIFTSLISGEVLERGLIQRSTGSNIISKSLCVKSKGQRVIARCHKPILLDILLLVSVDFVCNEWICSCIAELWRIKVTRQGVCRVRRRQQLLEGDAERPEGQAAAKWCLHFATLVSTWTFGPVCCTGVEPQMALHFWVCLVAGWRAER